MPKTCVINFARGNWYRAGQDRLEASLLEAGYQGDMLLFKDETELGCPPHEEVPYAFKPYALKKATDMGYEVVLWADASVWAIRPIEPALNLIVTQGHLFFYNCKCDTWTSDACMQGFGLIRDQLEIMPHLMGICMGWDMRRPKCQIFLERWMEKAKDGFSFPGSWTNHNHEVSNDPRVKGHRHDQAVGSILAWQLDMKLVISQDTVFQYYTNPQSISFFENPTYELIQPGVVLVAQGM